MRKTYRVKLSETVSEYNRDYAYANISHSFTGYDPQFTESNGFITFAVNTDEHLTNEVIREKLIHSSFISSVSSGDFKKRIVKVPKFADINDYPDFAHGKGINDSPLTDTASNNPFTTEQGKSGVDANLHIPDTQDAQYIIDQDNIRNPASDKRFSSWVIAKEKEQKVDEYGLPIPDDADGLPQGRTLADLWGGIGGMGTSNDKSGNS